MSQQYPNTRQSTKHSTSGEVDEETTIDARILAAIKLAVREEMGEISQLEKIDKALANIVEVQQRMEVAEESIQFTSERLDALATKVLPALSNRIAQIAETLAHQTLQIDVHRRKWNVFIHGIDGQAGEEEDVTRAKCIKFAREALKVDDADTWHLAACHRSKGKRRYHFAFHWPSSARQVADRDQESARPCQEDFGIGWPATHPSTT